MSQARKDLAAFQEVYYLVKCKSIYNSNFNVTLVSDLIIFFFVLFYYLVIVITHYIVVEIIVSVVVLVVNN